MDGGRRQRWINRRDNSQNMRGPRGFWKPNAWEKEFCKVVGTMDWGTFTRMRKFAYVSPSVLTWDDSAAKEAFDNAWRRFWYKKKGYVCDTPLPDPDLYIDTIDWDAEVDPQLWRDLENMPLVTEEEAHLPTYQEIIPTGWGDEFEKFEHMPIYYPHDSAGKMVHGWVPPAWPNWADAAGPSHAPPPATPTFVWQYPPHGGYWYYTNNYGGVPAMWDCNNVATSSSRAFEPSYNQTSRNDGGWRRPQHTKRRTQSK